MNQVVPYSPKLDGPTVPPPAQVTVQVSQYEDGGRGRREVERDSRALKTRPHSVHFPQQNGGEQDSDKEHQVGGRGRGRGQGGDSQVITASTWLSNILPAPKEDRTPSAREQSPSPQHKALVQIAEGEAGGPASTAISPMKPVNLLPEIPVQ